MEIILIDVGALALFLGYVSIVYWHAVLGETRPLEPRLNGEPRLSGGPRAPAVPPAAGRV